MNWQAENHSYKYAVEQMLFVLYPNEKHVCAPVEGGDGLLTALKYGKKYVTATAKIIAGDGFGVGRARAQVSELADPEMRDRLLQRIIKRAIFRAKQDGWPETLQWGALTGVRPVKLTTRLIEDGLTPRAAGMRLQREFFVSPQRAMLCLDAAAESLQVKKELKAEDISVYLGVPFCPTRCAYCSFVSQPAQQSKKLMAPFVEALLREIESTGRMMGETGMRPISFYMGGGTPTTMSAGELTAVMSALRRCPGWESVREYTVEAGRPDTITAEKLRAVREGGATRISINPQSMNSRALEAIGRAHSPEQVLEAYAMARQLGDFLINMDLIAGLPEDDHSTFRDSLTRIIDLEPDNITVHTLALKRGSAMWLEGRSVPDGQEVGRMLDTASELLRAAGYRPYYLYRQKFMSGGYENVGWAKPGCESLYNIVMMEELHTVAALGAGGVSKIINEQTGHIERIFNAKYAHEYIANIENILKNKEVLGEKWLKR